MEAKSFVAELINTKDLKPHPRNYQQHPDYQLRHIMKSIETHGFYRNVVVTADNTILAGHGVVEAATRLGIDKIPVHKVDLDANDTRALQILTGDNEINNLAVVNDRMLTELLKEIMVQDQEIGLTGTGFDEAQLASLVMITRPASEIKDKDEAAEWLGMPEWEGSSKRLTVIVSFESEKDRKEFADILGYTFTPTTKSIWFPHKPKDDTSSVEFQ
jgi:hypothetical protein